MENHLIIGLGGTGGKIIRALRKTIYQEFRSLAPPTARLGFFYVDSSAEMMGLDDPSWRILGKSVQLDVRNQMLLRGSNLQQTLEQIDNYPQIRPWIGDRAQWRDILNSIVGETLGGQKRRLGRFLFACKAADFSGRLRQLTSELQTGGSTAVTFHICGGLAGGTGSGSLIDVIAQVRHMYRDARNYKILLYELLPDQFPKANWNTGNYHANGYAALLELNALSVGSLAPHNVAEHGERLQLNDPFNGCYLFTNQNENGLQVDVDQELPNIAADFLFQKIVAATALHLATLNRMENAENGDGTPESRPGTNLGERSKRFLTFGIKRLAIPEEEIREYLTYKFARQSALQLRFNHWSDSLGFLDEARPQEFGEFVKQRDTHERWLLSDEHCCLSRGILPEEINNRRWKPLPQEWMDLIPEFVSLVQGKETATWLNELEKLCVQRYEDGFRGLGVRKFYDTKMAARKEHVRVIRGRIEAELFEEWKNGVKSLYDISRLLEALTVALDERLNTIDARVTRLKDNEEATAAKVTANRAEWAHVGILSQFFGKRRSLLDAQGECLRDLYIYRSQIEAWGFAKRLLQELSTEITRLATEVQHCTGLIDDAIQEFTERIAQRCHDEQLDLRQAVVRFYKPEKVWDFARDLDKDQTEQFRQAQGVRLALLEQLGENPNFATLYARITKQRLFDVLEEKCEASAKTAHDNLIMVNRDRSPLFGMNIVGVLEREFSGNPERLKTFIYDLVSRAGHYLDFQPDEIRRRAPGIAADIPTKVQQFLVVMPKTQEHSGFAEHLQLLFRQQVPGNIPVEIIASDTKPHEITLLSVTNLFPLRYVKPLAFLREQYEQRLRQTDKPARVRLELHCEGEGTNYPELFVPSREHLLTRFLPYVMLAKTLNIIQPITNQVTGSTDLFLIEQDEFGLDKRTKLGKNLPELFDTLDMLVAQHLEETVSQLLAGPEYRHQDTRTTLMAQIRDELKGILVDRQNNIEDPTYLGFEQAARTAIQRLRPSG